MIDRHMGGRRDLQICYQARYITANSLPVRPRRYYEERRGLSFFIAGQSAKPIFLPICSGTCDYILVVNRSFSA